MSITAEELRTIGNAETGRSETQDQIDKYVKEWAHELTTKGIVLEAEEDITLVDEQPNYVEATYLTTNTFKKISAITIVDTNDEESPPLEEISWQRYKERNAQSSTPTKPSEYARFNKTLFLWPPPDTDLYPTARVSGTIRHADSTTISYHERFRKCASMYIIFRIHMKYGYADTKGKPFFGLYENSREDLMSDQSTREVSVQRYNDI